MALYGGGAHTRWLLQVTEDMPSPPIAAILDDNAEGGETIAGIPLVKPSEFRKGSADLILISSDQWEGQLADRARSECGPTVDIMRLYEGLPRGPYDKSDDKSEALAALENRSNRLPSQLRQVVVVSDAPRSREAKICYALSRAGFETVLLCKRMPSFNAQAVVSELCLYEHEWQALRIASEFNPIAFHCMANSDYRTAELFVRHRPRKVVVDSYDLIAGMYTDEFFASSPSYEMEIARERFCLEHADGLCCRSPEIEHLETNLGYHCAPRLFLPDGCWNRPVIPRQRNDGAIHIAYVGGLTPESSCEGVVEEGHRLWLAKAMHDQAIHFHLFPATSLCGDAFEQGFEPYRRLERSGPYIHLHATAPADLLIERLSAMDFGIFVYNEFVPECGGKRYCAAETTRRLASAKLKLCTSNKFYDYLDAGLPVIHNAVEGGNLAAIVSRFGAGIDVSDAPLSEWGQLFRDVDNELLRQKTIEAREAYGIADHGSKLANFYESLGNEKLNVNPDNRAEELAYASDGN